MFLDQFFVKNAKMTLKHLLNGRNRIKLENRENVEIPGKGAKNGHFRPSKCHKLVTFKDMDLNFCTPDRVLSHIFRFFENAKIFLENFCK